MEVDDDLGDGRRLVRVLRGDPEAAGELPLPPYIHEHPDDPERYQTVFARRLGVGGCAHRRAPPDAMRCSPP